MDISGGLGRSAGKVMFHCIFIVLRILMFSMSSSHDTVIRMSFHCFENPTVLHAMQS